MDACTWMQDGRYREDRRMMRSIKVCYQCPNRDRHINEDGSVYDCHSHCEEYKAACDREMEKVQTMRKHSKAEFDLYNYHIADKEKRRKKSGTFKFCR